MPTIARRWADHTPDFKALPAKLTDSDPAKTRARKTPQNVQPQSTKKAPVGARISTPPLRGEVLCESPDIAPSRLEFASAKRDDEFVNTLGTRDELIASWDSGWQRLFDSLSSLSSDDLAKTVTIRGESHSVPLAIQRSLAHCAYHVGQIMLIARILAGDHWTTITIPRGASAKFNQQVWGKGHYQSPPPEQK